MTAILLYVRKHEIKNGTESFDSVPEIKSKNEFYMKKNLFCFDYYNAIITLIHQTLHEVGDILGSQRLI